MTFGWNKKWQTKFENTLNSINIKTQQKIGRVLTVTFITLKAYMRKQLILNQWAKLPP